MNSTKELFLQAMCEKHGGNFETVKDYIEIFNDMLREINFTSSLVCIELILWKKLRHFLLKFLNNI